MQIFLKRPFHFLGLILFIITISFMLVACVTSTSEQSETAQSDLSTIDATPTVYVPPTGSGSVRYILDWEMGKAVFAEDQASWSAETESGYLVTLKEGSLTSATIQLVDCVESQTANTFSLIKTASAGHGDSLDPTLISGPFIESLTQPQKLETETIGDLGASYCQGHYVVSGQNSTGLPSLTLEGSWQSLATGQSGTFNIDSALAWGQVHALEETINFEQGQVVTITVTRNLSTIFDTADFASMSDSEITRAILRQLTQTATFSISTN